MYEISFMMRIVYIVGGLYQPSGMGQVLSCKVNYLAEHTDWQVYVILTERPDLPFFYQLANNVQFVNFDINFDELWDCSFFKKAFLYLVKQQCYKRRLRNALMSLRPDITDSLLRREINFINQIKDGSRKMGEMHVLRSHFRNFEKNDTNFLKELFAKYWMYRLIGELRKLDRMVVLTETDAASWTELSNVVAIPNPLPMMPKTVSPLTEKRVIAVGRYYQEKGFDLLLEAWSKIYQQHPYWRLEIFGDGERKNYEAIRDRLGIPASCCIINGRSNNIEQEYLKSSVFVCSSRFEGFGMVIIEAMACGLAVVSFDCPYGPRSIIADGEDGILVEAENTDKLAEALSSVMGSPEKCHLLATNAIQNVKRFQMDEIANQWKQLFESIV